MTKQALTTLTVLLLMNSQSFAAACLLSCQTSVENVISSTSSETQDCHSSKNEVPKKDSNCNLTICESLSQHNDVKIKPEATPTAKKIAIFPQVVLLKPIFLKEPSLYAYNYVPTPQKMRLHLRLQRLLN